MELRIRLPRFSTGGVSNVAGVLGLVAIALAVGGLIGVWWWALLVGGVFAVAVAYMAGLSAEQAEQVEAAGRPRPVKAA